jgi:flagellar motor protein MotB
MNQLCLKKSLCGIVLLSALFTISGCTNWKENYAVCQAERENLEALYDGANRALNDSQNEKLALAAQLQSLRNQKRTQTNVAEKSNYGFNGEDVSYDASRGTITVTLANATLFDSGSIRLKKVAKSRLKGIAQEIKTKFGGKEISVVGHTDTDPIKKSKWADNWQLSTERSLSVTRYLLSQGISGDQIVASGRGQYSPIGKAKSKNRRVEIVVHTY